MKREKERKTKKSGYARDRHKDRHRAIASAPGKSMHKPTSLSGLKIYEIDVFNP